MAQQATLMECMKSEVELTDEQSAAVNTALNRVDKTSIYSYGEDIPDSLIPEAIEALEGYIEVLEGVVGKATLMDPNDENVYLEWCRSARDKLQDHRST